MLGSCVLAGERSQAVDRFLTGRWTAIPCFVAIMATIFVLTFNVIGAWLQEKLEVLLDMGTVVADAALTRAGVSDALHSLIIDGVFAGVGSVLSFMPIILVMFMFLSLLEDSGYLARVAFFMDKPLRRIGLSGRSIVPMLIGFGCTVPAVMSSRTLPSDRDRRMTILLTPFMSCTAKLPIYAFFVSSFFPFTVTATTPPPAAAWNSFASRTFASSSISFCCSCICFCIFCACFIRLFMPPGIIPPGYPPLFAMSLPPATGQSLSTGKLILSSISCSETV